MAKKTKHVKSTLTDFNKRFNEIYARPGKQWTAQLPVTVTPTNIHELEALAENFEERVGLIVKEFIRTEVIPRITSEFYDRAGDSRAYSPVYLKHDADPNEYLDEEGEVKFKAFDFANVNAGLEQGYAELIKALTDFKVDVLGGSVHAGVGPRAKLMAIKLSDHLGGSGQSRWNSFWYAVEFGTGIAANVGGPRWVNKDGDTKDSRRRPTKDGKASQRATKDGSWWIGQPGQGTLVLGQRGFNMFYTRAERKPKTLWLKLFSEELPKFLQKRLLARYPNSF